MATVDELLTKTFAQRRRALQSDEERARNRLKKDFNRFAAANQLQGSGALLKAQKVAQQEIDREIEDRRAQLGAEESGTLAQVGLQREQQQFAAEEAEKAREFQRPFLEKEFEIKFRELEESLKNNFINAAIALKDAGLKTAKDWRFLFDSFRTGGGRTERSSQGALNLLFGGLPEVRETDRGFQFSNRGRLSF